MRLSPILFSLSASLFLFPVLMNASEAPEITASDKEPELQQLDSERKRATGLITATIDGKKEEFMTTSEKIEISEERIKAADPRAHETLRRMNGKMVETASLKAIGSVIYVSINGYGDIGKTGPNTSGSKATSLKLAFALAPDTLLPLDGQREVSYAAPGVDIGDQAMDKAAELKVDSITKLPNGALALKGSFSATLTKTLQGKDLPKPIKVEGSFNIDRAAPDKAVLGLLQEATKKD